MKILIISPGKLPVPAVCGGAVENLIQQLIDDNEKEKKYDYTLISISNSLVMQKSKEYKNTNFKFINCSSFFYKLFRGLRYIINRIPGIYIGNEYIYRVKKLIKKEINNYDIVLIENSPEYGLVLEHKNMILHMHNDFLNKNTDMAKKILNKYQKVFSLSYYISGRIGEIDKEYKNVYTLYNGVDFKKFDIDRSIEICNKYNINSNDYLFMFTGRIVPEKGVLELVRAFKLLNEINVKLMIVGDISNNSSYIKKIKKELNENIILTGKVNYDDIPKYYSIANVGVVPSTWEEPFALTVIEHIASGHPVIITKSGAMPELVNEKVGLIVKKDENVIEHLAEAMSIMYKSDRYDKKVLSAHALQFDSSIYCKTFDNYILGDGNNEN